MSPRTTRSAARTAARLAANQSPDSILTPSATEPSNTTKKRKSRTSESEIATDPAPAPTSTRQPKRQKFQSATEAVASKEAKSTTLTRASDRRRRGVMSTSGYSQSSGSLHDSSIDIHRPSNGEEDDISTPTTSTRKKQTKGKKNIQPADPSPSTPQPNSRRLKKPAKKSDEPTPQDDPGKRQNTKTLSKKGTRGAKAQTQESHSPDSDDDDDDVDMDDEDDDLDHGSGLFSRNSFLGRGGMSGLSQARAMLGGFMPNTGTASKLRGLLQSIKTHEDPTIQVLAMEELAEILLISNEDNLNGQFVPDQFVKELVLIMRGGEYGTSSPEMMELACRCIANLLEALPQATHAVVAGGAIPVLCEKLTNMEYMEQAEQAMTTLSKISDEFPGAIVRDGGLMACLMHLDFFTTYMQKTAVSTAAKCCFDLSEGSFDAVQAVMPTLQNVLNNSEQEVVKQAALCITRIVNRFGSHENLEQLVTPELLRTVFRLLLPASVNIVGDDVQTRFLGMLSTTARASPKLAADLLKNDVVDIIYQFLTGVSPPEGSEDLGAKIDGVIVMQALIHKPRDQIFGALNVICQILPDNAAQALQSIHSAPLEFRLGDTSSSSAKKRLNMNAQRLMAFESCKDKVKRFVTILLPTLTHAYDITVNLNVRSTVLDAQLKMLSNIDSEILESALRTVPFASFLASILSQQDHNNLVLQALQATDLLLQRLRSIYGYQFCREGVLAEVTRLAEQKISEKPPSKVEVTAPSATSRHSTPLVSMDTDDDEDEEDSIDIADHRSADAARNEESDEIDDVNMTAEREYPDDMSGSGESSDEEVPSYLYGADNTKDQIIMKARKIRESFDDGNGKQIKQQAEGILVTGRTLAFELRDHYQSDAYKDEAQTTTDLFNQIAQYFSADPLRSITSAELLNTELVEGFLDVLDLKHGTRAEHARQAFVGAFMRSQSSSNSSTITPLNILIHKLQDLLSRKEHLEVVTVHNNSQENARMDKDNLSYQLGKQIRLKLEGSEGSEIPARYRNVVISIHAIATLKSLNDYLRPRMLMSSEGISRNDVLSTLAALTGSELPHRQRMLMERALQHSRSESSAAAAAAASPMAMNASQQLKSLQDRAAAYATLQNLAQTPTPTEKQPIRRSSRRHKALEDTEALGVAEKDSLEEPDESKETLECADEHNLEEGEEEDDDNDNEDEVEDGELQAFVDDLEQELEEETLSDPDPVNLEVASTGKVTARQEDGTRIGTPSQGLSAFPTIGQPPSLGHVPSSGTGSPRTTSGARSYAAAVQSTPQDWHLEFSIYGKPIPLHTTVYRAVHFNKPESTDESSKSVWSSTHTIKYRKAPGPPPEQETLESSEEGKNANELPDSLHKNPVTSKILRLLDFLHDMNSNLDNFTEGDTDKQLQLHSESATQFVNTKLTAKLNRQLEEPLIVASKCLPQWSEDLVRLYPFLFPFEARYLYLQSNYFGYHRAIERWTQVQNEESRRDRRRDDRPYLAMPKKQKVRIARERLFDSAIKVLDLYATATASLEVEYFDEVGTGLGPTMEFYANVSKEFALKKHNLWRRSESSNDSDYVFSKRGLFPAPMSEKQLASDEGKRILSLFKALGKFVGRSMLDSRMIDISFNPLFFQLGTGSNSTIPPIVAVKHVDQDLANSLKYIQIVANRKSSLSSRRLSGTQRAQASNKIDIELESLGLDMTLPGYPAIELVANGRNLNVTADNIELYIAKVISFTVDQGVARQVQEFKKGFSEVFSYTALNAFTADELVMIFGNTDEDWSVPTLIDSIKADHGFNIDSVPVRNLVQVMSELDDVHRRLFLQFVTGSPKLPIGGFKKLIPTFTVVLRKDGSGAPADEFLPSVMTCTNYLKLPDYSSLDVMRLRINQAIKEGQGAFHLS